MTKEAAINVFINILMAIAFVVAIWVVVGGSFYLGQVVGESKADEKALVTDKVCSEVFIPDNRFIVPWELKIEVPDGYKIYACKEAM